MDTECRLIQVQRTGHVTSHSRPNGGASRHANLASAKGGTLLEQVVSLAVVVASTDADHGRNGGNESSLHGEESKDKNLL